MEIKYILEIQEGGVAKRSITLPLVDNVSYERTTTGIVTWTLGDEPLREFSGVRGHRMSFSGNSGQLFRFGKDRHGTRIFASGPELFRQYDLFLRDYETLALDRQQSGAALNSPTRLVLRALWENVSLRVEQAKFTWQRSTKIGPQATAWTLQLNAYAYDETKQKAGVFDKLTSPLAAATKTIDSATSYGSFAIESLENVRGALDQARGPIQALGRMSRQASVIAEAAQSIRRWPHDLVADLFSVADAATIATFDSWAALPLIDRQSVRSVMIDTLGPMAEVRRDALTWLGLNFIDIRGIEDPSTGSVDYTSSSRQQNVNASPMKSYKVSAGQDVWGVAQDVTGDRSQWLAVVRQNGMSDPFTNPDGSPVSPGDSVFVPLADSATGLPGSAITGDPYGTDIMLGPHGGMVMEGTTDIAVASGKANLLQSLVLRSTTVQGTNATFPSIGFPEVGEALGAESAGILASQGRSQFASDPRIESVTELAVDDSDGDRLIMTALLQPVEGAAFSIATPISQGA